MVLCEKFNAKQTKFELLLTLTTSPTQLNKKNISKCEFNNCKLGSHLYRPRSQSIKTLTPQSHKRANCQKQGFEL